VTETKQQFATLLFKIMSFKGLHSREKGVYSLNDEHKEKRYD